MKSRKRKNHGRRVPAGEILRAFVDLHVPEHRQRLVRLQSAWKDAATSRLYGRAWPIAVNGTELVVVVHDNQWLHELTYLRDDLLARIRSRCPEAGIERLRLRVGDVPVTVAEPVAPTRTEAWEPYTAEPSESTLAALERIEDPDLRKAIATARVAMSKR